MLPYRRLRIMTRLRPPEVARALDSLISGPNASYDGVVSSSAFELRRRTLMANAWRPIVFGSVESAPGGAVVDVVLRPNLLVLVFTAFWVGGAMIGALTIAFTSPERGAPLALLFPLLGIAFVAACFQPEAREAEAALRAGLPPLDPPPGDPDRGPPR